MGGDRLHPPWSAGLLLPAGIHPAPRPDRPVLRPGPPASDRGQARPGGSRPDQRETPPRHAFTQALAGHQVDGGRHTGRADRRHPRPPVNSIDRRVSEVVAGRQHLGFAARQAEEFVSALLCVRRLGLGRPGIRRCEAEPRASGEPRRHAPPGAVRSPRCATRRRRPAPRPPANGNRP